MRYGKEHKQATRERIVQAAGRRFKRDGIDGSGVSALMADAGLTNGAFYKHFSSKEDLVANVLADQLREQLESLDDVPAGRGGVELFVRHYLSPEHRDHRDHGCPSAALLDEIGRLTDTTKEVYGDGLTAFMDALAGRLSPGQPQVPRSATLAVFAMMIGAVQLSRALVDRELGDELLTRAAENALTLLDAAAEPHPERD
ncbi:TetR/AcrR family transcriptional regulator [Streptomyces sp. SCL15-6]|uniref:TetR/AcrR family transcriptional regulator n=1 Tax=Streptomyces sp. SCL15-6 TaxID=2967222 RepID=UPI002966B5DB|nr:TetR/AcrR family transcriptional regulator [Streptomyces sp. SCL15-6]